MIQKKYIINIIVLLLVTVSLVLILIYFPIQGKVANDITKDKILSLKIDMSEKEVVGILGKPLSVDTSFTDSGHILNYATGGWFGMGTKIYIKILNNSLSYVYIKYLDLGIYIHNKEKKIKSFNLKSLINYLVQNIILFKEYDFTLYRLG